jgi:hypothetical protein
MDNLILEHRGLSIRRKVAGSLWILLAILYLILGKTPHEQKDWIISIMFFILGIVHFTPLMGSTKSQIQIYEESLKIMWMNWIRSVTIRENEIERIVMARDGIKIYRKSEKVVKILLYNMKREQKTLVYTFFEKYCHQKGFVLEK